MPPVVAAVGAAFSGISIAKVVTSLVFNFVLGAVSKKLTKRKASSGSSGSQEGVERRHLIRGSVEPHRVVYGRVLTSGTLVHIEVVGDRFLFAVMEFAGHECDAIEAYYLNERVVGDRRADGAVTTGEWKPIRDENGTDVIILRIVPQLGDHTEALGLHLAGSKKWTAAHIGHGITAAWFSLYYDQSTTTKESGDEHWPTGIPNMAAVVRGKKVFDPRTGVVEWSDNPALCILDYLRWEDGVGAPDSEIDFDSFAAAADVCDELIDYIDSEGVTRQGVRYRCAATFRVDRDRRDILADLLSSCGGRLVKRNAVWHLFPAAATAVTLAPITEDDLWNSVQVRPRASRFDLFNEVRGTFFDESDLWREHQFQAVTAAAYVQQDGGRSYVRDIELPATPARYMARRLAKIELERHRAPLEATLPVKLSAFEVSVWDVVPVTIAAFGWSAKPFRVGRMSIEPGGMLTLHVQEENAAIYALQPDDQPDVPLTTQPESAVAGVPGPPSRPRVTEQLYVARNGAGVRAKAILAWSAPVDRDYAALYRVRYRLEGATRWQDGPVVGEAEAEIFDISAGVYEFGVRGVSASGLASAWSPTRRAEIYALSARPATPTNLRLSTFLGTANLSWDPAADLDVEIGGAFLLRHSALTAGATWASGVPIGGAIPGNSSAITVASRPGTYMIRARDSTGQLSPSFASISTTSPDVIAFTLLATVTEDPTFLGVKTGCAVATGSLLVNVVGDIDSWADTDTVANWDLETGAIAASSYAFANQYDHGSVAALRVLPAIQTDVTQHLPLWDDRGLPIDEWLDVDGSVDGDEFEARVQFRHTPDDPAGSPTWSEWSQLDGTEISARAMQFRVIMATSDPAYRGQIDALAAKIYGVT